MRTAAGSLLSTIHVSNMVGAAADGRSGATPIESDLPQSRGVVSSEFLCSARGVDWSNCSDGGWSMQMGREEGRVTVENLAVTSRWREARLGHSIPATRFPSDVNTIFPLISFCSRKFRREENLTASLLVPSPSRCA